MSEGTVFFSKKQKVQQEPGSRRILNKREKFVYRAIYFVGILGPAMTIPQVIKIWGEQEATGVSVVSWGAYSLLSIFWIIYGIVDRDKPIIFMFTAYFILNILVVIGTIQYG